MHFFDWTMIILIPGFILSMYAMFRLKSIHAKHLNTLSQSGMTGAEVAKAILEHAGIRNVSIDPYADTHASKTEVIKGGLNRVSIQLTPGSLSDHYDPRHGVLRLSEEHFNSSSLSAIGVAAHEAGHAIQHKEKYFPLDMRMAIVGVTNIGSMGGPILFFLGLLFRSPPLLQLGIWLFSAIVVFQLITLPVEFDASSRARRVLNDLQITGPQESAIVGKVLNAAALTYVAALVMALLQLLRMILIARNSR